MRNIVIVGISDTADRIILFIERYKLFNVLGCTVDKIYVPKDGYVVLGGEEDRYGLWKSLTST